MGPDAGDEGVGASRLHGHTHHRCLTLRPLVHQIGCHRVVVLMHALFSRVAKLQAHQAPGQSAQGQDAVAFHFQFQAMPAVQYRAAEEPVVKGQKGAGPASTSCAVMWMGDCRIPWLQAANSGCRFPQALGPRSPLP